MSEAPQIYLDLIKQHGMPDCATLMEMNGVWYEVPEDVDADANDPVGTAVFRPLQPDGAARLMAEHATRWAKTFHQGELPEEPVARLKAIREAAAAR